MAHFAFPPRASFRKGDRISCGSAAILSDKSTDELADYVAKWHGHLTRWFGPRMDVAGKRVLVIGSQYGPEILWALRNGAHEVVGLDPENCSSDALLLALDRLGLGERRDAFRMVAATTHEAGDIGTFDYVMSNNVFEHVEALSHTLRSTARFLPDPGGRLIIFADPLFLSSQGHHTRLDAWEHLTKSQEAIRAIVPPRQYEAYRATLNGMTLTSFLEAVREAGLLLLDLGIVPDRALDRFGEIAPQLPPGLKPMDLCVEGLVCTLAFPHNLSPHQTRA